VWAPGEHNGTFRGNNPAFVTAKKAIDTYWSDDTFENEVITKGERIRDSFISLCSAHQGISTRGRGMVQGLVFDDADKAGKVCALAYDRGLLVETSGPSDQVVKLLPPLTITNEELDQGLAILGQATAQVLSA
jgi:diaminobutyrate-2-oxoglutarate transaminase